MLRPRFWLVLLLQEEVGLGDDAYQASVAVHDRESAHRVLIHEASDLLERRRVGHRHHRSSHHVSHPPVHRFLPSPTRAWPSEDGQSGTDSRLHRMHGRMRGQGPSTSWRWDHGHLDKAGKHRSVRGGAVRMRLGGSPCVP